jgi:hypothetical protein
MPQVVEHIDRIARQRKQAVLFLEFHPYYDPKSHDFDKYFEPFDYKHCEVRDEIIGWFKKNGIKYESCFSIRHDWCLCEPYNGQLFIDVPYDKNDPDYIKLETYLENPDGTVKFEDVRFYVLSYEVALQNKHHDDPEYWDNF